MQQANVWITFCTVSNKRSIIEVTKTFTNEKITKRSTRHSSSVCSPSRLVQDYILRTILIDWVGM